MCSLPLRCACAVSVLVGLLGLASRASAALAVEAPAVETAQNHLPPADLLDRWEIDFETGVLWRVGGRATPLDYVVLPQLFTVKTPRVWSRPWGGGDLILRSRFSLLIEPIVRGPEHAYIGVAAAGCLEWWDAERRLCYFFSSGGGVGGMDSKGREVEGAQGQDLNFNWLVYAGARYRFRDTLNASFGVYFQHVSNTGLHEINPGLDAVGPMLSLGWHF